MTQEVKKLFEGFDPILHGLIVPEPHRRATVQADLMRGSHDVQPLLSITLERRNPVSHLINQDFSSPTRDRSKSGLFEPQDNFTQWQPEYFCKMIKLRRTECVDVDLRIFLPDVIQQVEVIVDAQLRVVTALHQYLAPSDEHKFIILLIYIFVTQNVMIGVPLCSIECTKL